MPEFDTGVPHILRQVVYVDNDPFVLSHPARDQVTAAIGAETSLTKSMGQKVTFRTRDEVAGLAAGLDRVDPGVVPVQEWRPDSPPDTGSLPTALWGLVARKP